MVAHGRGWVGVALEEGAGRMDESVDYRGRGGPECPEVGADMENPGDHTLAWGDNREGSCEVVGWVDNVGSLSGAWGLLV